MDPGAWLVICLPLLCGISYQDRPFLTLHRSFVKLLNQKALREQGRLFVELAAIQTKKCLMHGLDGYFNVFCLAGIASISPALSDLQASRIINMESLLSRRFFGGQDFPSCAARPGMAEEQGCQAVIAQP